MFHRILLAIDGTAAGPVAVSFTIPLAAPGARVHVVHINQYQVSGRGTTVESVQEAALLVRDAVSELRAAGVRATGLAAAATCFGVADRIVMEGERWSADAIVLGSRRHRGLRRLLRQGVRGRIIRLSELPVLTAPAPLRVSSRPGRAGQPPRPRHGRSPISS
jgi:nucleotide-binding universal stress UspA family protein